MGLEMIGLLVHTPTLDLLMNCSWAELATGMAVGSFRDRRPEQDHQLTNSFAIDAEAELLDWMDEQDVAGEPSVREALLACQDGEEDLLLLMKWSSPGQGEVWEGRAVRSLDQAWRNVVKRVP